MKNEKGITLASLTLTIIILIILSAVAINSGVGTIRYTKFNKAKSEIEIMQTNVNSWYQEYMNVKYEEGATEEETQANKLAKQQEVIDKYGVDTSDSSCDQTALTKTVNATGITSTDYKFLSASYIKNNLGLDASFDYLINIPSRSVILFNGVKYNGDTYYTTEDFGILKVESTSVSSVSFQLKQNNNSPDVYIYNLNFKDNEGKDVNISKFKTLVSEENTNKWIDATDRVTATTYNSQKAYLLSGLEYGKTYDVKITTTDNKIENNNTETIAVKARPGIEVGDYITYTSPTASVTFNEAETGYFKYATTPETLTAKDTFRVMDIDKNGSMTLIGAMTSDDQKIYFSGAKGYNNAVYTLNKKCSDLYSDTSKGITARSIKVEDITDKFNQTGTDKLTSYIDTKLSSLTTGTYVTNVDTTNRQVTYQTRTNYPDIFQYESGGLIDGTATSGIIAQSESYSGYNGLTTLANKTPKPTSLTVPYTYYFTKHASTDFADTERAVAYQNIFFETGTRLLACFALYQLRLELCVFPRAPCERHLLEH